MATFLRYGVVSAALVVNLGCAEDNEMPLGPSGRLDHEQDTDPADVPDHRADAGSAEGN